MRSGLFKNHLCAFYTPIFTEHNNTELAKDDNQNEEDTYKQLQKVVDDVKNKKGDTYDLMKKKYKKKLKNSQTTLNSDQMSEVTLDGHAAPQVGCLIVVVVIIIFIALIMIVGSLIIKLIK